MNSQSKYNQIQLSNLKQKLPQLNNCDNIANHWAGELFTLFPGGVRKVWDSGLHIEFKENQWSSTKKIYISSTFDIINNENELPFDTNTYILISAPKSNEATFFKWTERYDIWNYSYLEKINKNTFKIRKPDKEEIKTYIQSQKLGGLTKLQRFCSQSLVALAMKKSSSKGAINSNKNSQTQSIRKKGKIVNGKSVKMEFNCPDAYNVENKTVLDAYRIAAGKYNYKKSLMQFHRDLEKGQIRLEMDGFHSLYCSLDVIIPVNNIYINSEILKTENTNISRDDNIIQNIISEKQRVVTTSSEENVKNDKSVNSVTDNNYLLNNNNTTTTLIPNVDTFNSDVNLTHIETEWLEYCKSVPEEDRLSKEEFAGYIKN